MVRPPAMTTSAVGQLRDCLAGSGQGSASPHPTLRRWPMFFRFTLATALAVLCSGPTLAQQATVYDKSQDTRLDDLAKQLAALTTRVSTAEKSVSDIDRRISELTTNVTK